MQSLLLLKIQLPQNNDNNWTPIDSKTELNLNLKKFMIINIKDKT
jgi:hypothetical protein